MNAGLVAFLAGLTVLLAAYALFAPKSPPRRDKIQDKIFQADEDTTDNAQGFVKYVRPMLGEFMPSVPGLTNISDDSRDKISKLLVRSGNPWKLRPEEFVGTQFLFAVLGAAIGLVLTFLDLVPLDWYFMVLGLGIAGYSIPFSVYNTAKERRAKEIQKQLPEALDLLVVTMTSGMNFEPALSEVTPRMPDGLLKQEFAKISSEITSGRTLESSLLAFADRAASDEAESFAKSVAQSQRLGADVSETLSTQATAARDSYEALLDRKIAKLSTTMFAVLAPTMLPAFLLIFVAPSLSQLSGGFGI